MRERYRGLLREEVADTLDEGESIDEEVRYLCAILADQTAQTNWNCEFLP